MWERVQRLKKDWDLGRGTEKELDNLSVRLKGTVTL